MLRSGTLINIAQTQPVSPGQQKVLDYMMKELSRQERELHEPDKTNADRIHEEAAARRARHGVQINLSDGRKPLTGTYERLVRDTEHFEESHG